MFADFFGDLNWVGGTSAAKIEILAPTAESFQEPAEKAEAVEMVKAPQVSVLGGMVGQMSEVVGAKLAEVGSAQLELPLNSTAALKLDSKTYESSDAYISSDFTRRMVCDDAKHHHRELVWEETFGVAEISASGKHGIPVGMAVDATMSVKTGGLLRYRRLEPLNKIHREASRVEAIAKALNLPVDASAALAMPQGCEIEFEGSGQLALGAKLENCLFKGAATKGTPAASVSYGLSGEAEKGFAILVKSLPDNLVQVRFKERTGHSEELSVSAEGGLGFVKELEKALPKDSRPLLQRMVDKSCKKRVAELVKTSKHAKVGVKAFQGSLKDDTLCFTFDLTKPKAIQAYESIFQGLTFEQAAESAERGGEGVMCRQLLATKEDSGVEASLSLGDVNLVKAQMRSSTKVSNLRGKNIERVVTDVQFEDSYSDWINGTKSTQWQAVEVKDKKTGEAETYYNLKHTNKDSVTQQAEVEDFFAFAKSLGVKIINQAWRLPMMSMLTKIFSYKDDSQVKVDLYISDSGIKRIDYADEPESCAAFMKCAAAYKEEKPEFSYFKKCKSSGLDAMDYDHPAYKALVEYRDLSNSWFWTRLYNWGKFYRLERVYEESTSGRNVRRDVELLSKAETFATRMAALNISEEPGSVKNFFSNLGKQVKSDFMLTMGAMTQIAGEEEVIIDELSMKLGGMNHSVVSEGRLTHPEQAMAAFLMEPLTSEPALA